MRRKVDMCEHIVSVLLLFVYWICFDSLAGPELSAAADAGLSRQSILKELLQSKTDDEEYKYDPKISPDFELDTPTIVKIRMFIQNIHSVSESSMDYYVDLLFRQNWVDARLKYGHMSNASNLELDNKLMDQVWVPDTYFTNEKQGSVHQVTVPNRMMHLHSDGTIIYSMRLSLRLACVMMLQRYPLDNQNCPIILESYGYSTDNIVYQWEEPNPVQLLSDVIVPQFYPATHHAHGSCSKSYSESVGQFSCLKTSIELRRKMGYYIVQVFVPSILIVALSWVSFWVDHDAVPARISLGVLTVLTMTTQSSGAKQTLPQVSYVKAIDVWMFTCLIFVFVALLEYSYVNVVARRRFKIRNITINIPMEDTAKSSSEQSLKRSTSKTEVLLEGQNKETCIDRSSEVAAREAELAANESERRARRVDKVSRVIFPAAFLVFNIFFWTFYALVPH